MTGVIGQCCLGFLASGTADNQHLRIAIGFEVVRNRQIAVPEMATGVLRHGGTNLLVITIETIEIAGLGAAIIGDPLESVVAIDLLPHKFIIDDIYLRDGIPISPFQRATQGRELTLVHVRNEGFYFGPVEWSNHDRSSDSESDTFPNSGFRE